MAEYSTRIKTTKRHEVVLHNPTNWVEFTKALNVAVMSWQNAHATERQPWDNSLVVEANEDEIIISFEAPTTE